MCVLATRSQRPLGIHTARIWGQPYMHSLQPCQLENDSLLNMVPMPPLGIAWSCLYGEDDA